MSGNWRHVACRWVKLILEDVMKAIFGRFVVTPHGATPYKVVLEREGDADIEKAVLTVRAGEAIIREFAPAVPLRPDLSGRPGTPES